MRDATFTLLASACDARPPFSYQHIAMRRCRAFWRVREANGRAIGEARTRAGARAAVRQLYTERGMGWEARDVAN